MRAKFPSAEKSAPFWKVYLNELFRKKETKILLPLLVVLIPLCVAKIATRSAASSLELAKAERVLSAATLRESTGFAEWWTHASPIFIKAPSLAEGYERELLQRLLLDGALTGTSLKELFNSAAQRSEKQESCSLAREIGSMSWQLEQGDSAKVLAHSLELAKKLSSDLPSKSSDQLLALYNLFLLESLADKLSDQRVKEEARLAIEASIFPSMEPLSAKPALSIFLSAQAATIAKGLFGESPLLLKEALIRAKNATSRDLQDERLVEDR